MVRDVTEAEFQAQVIDRSRELPVVVDFWADWCGPCRALSPALERAAAAREGRVDLAKVDVDANQRVAQAFRVQGIPAVKALRDGRVVEEFTGAIPPAEVERFFDRLVPSQAELAADEAIRSGDEEALRTALEADPRNSRVASALGRILLRRGEPGAAVDVLAPHEHDFLANGLRARAELALDDADLDEAFEAWDEGHHGSALEHLQAAIRDTEDPATRDRLRRVMVALFTELGDDPLVREHRRRLSAALN